MTSPDFFPATEAVIGESPLIVRRVVRWGDCDPAGIVYTPRFLDYTVSAYEAFIGLMLGGPLHSTETSGVSFPVRGVELDFCSPLPVDAQFDMEIRVGEIRSRTFDLHVTATRVATPLQPRQVAFRARITPVTVDGTRWTAVPLPDALRLRIAAYADAHPLHSETSQ